MVEMAEEMLVEALGARVWRGYYCEMNFVKGKLWRVRRFGDSVCFWQFRAGDSLLRMIWWEVFGLGMVWCVIGDDVVCGIDLVGIVGKNYGVETIVKGTAKLRGVVVVGMVWRQLFGGDSGKKICRGGCRVVRITKLELHIGRCPSHVPQINPLRELHTRREKIPIL